MAKNEELVKKPLKRGAMVGSGDQGIYVQEPDSRKIYVVPPAIFVVWSICNGTATVSEMAEALGKETDMKKEDVQSVLVTVLGALAKAKLVTW